MSKYSQGFLGASHKFDKIHSKLKEYIREMVSPMIGEKITEDSIKELQSRIEKAIPLPGVNIRTSIPNDRPDYIIVAIEGYQIVVNVFAESSPKKTHYLMQFFEYKHLPPHLRTISALFGELAQELVDTLPDNQETTTALRKILEAKDCAVRAALFKPLPTQAVMD